MIDSPYLVRPGRKIDLSQWSTDDTGAFKNKKEAKKPTKHNLKSLIRLQDRLYASAEYSVLIVFQAMDGGGKDGAIEHVFSGVNPQGCNVTSFKEPTHIELAHDFLWRIHSATPSRGIIGVFNRSHYESVVVERVKKLVPEKVWSRRYDHINNFERNLIDDRTIILKFFLHISWEEQKPARSPPEGPGQELEVQSVRFEGAQTVGRVYEGVSGRDFRVLDEKRALVHRAGRP